MHRNARNGTLMENAGFTTQPCLFPGVSAVLSVKETCTLQWEFSVEDVVKARAEYGPTDFRRDLAEEVPANVPADGEAQQTRSFNLIYHMCYALATDKKFDDFLAVYAYDPPTCQFLTELRPHMADNVAMLGAILQRLIMDRVEASMPLDQAVQDAAQWHASLVAGRVPGAE